MIRTIVTYGVVAGLLVGVTLSALIASQQGHSPMQSSMVVGYLAMLIAFSAIFIAVKRRRDVVGGGVIGFWAAFALGLGISAVASIVYVLCWEATQALTGMDFATDYSNAVIAEQRASGVSGAALDTLVAEMATFKVQYANPLFRLPMTFTEIFPVGVLVSLVSAALLRNRRFLPARAAATAS